MSMFDPVCDSCNSYLSHEEIENNEGMDVKVCSDCLNSLEDN